MPEPLRQKIRVTSQAEKSLTDRIEQISAGLREKFKKGSEGSRFWWPKEVFDDYVISTEDESAKLFKIHYTIDGDAVTFGEPVQVEEEYVEVESEAAQSGVESNVELPVALIRQSLDVEGWRWRVDALRFGLSETRDIWEAEVFRQSISQWDGLQAYADHPTQTEMLELPERSVRNIVGWYGNFAVTAQSMEADFNIKPSADWLRKDLVAAYRSDKRDLYGFSILVLTQAKQVRWSDGKPATKHTRIVKPISIDVVTKAAAGGQIKYALASRRARPQYPPATAGGSEGESTMNKKVLALLLRGNVSRFQLVRQALAQASVEGVKADSTEEQVAELIAGNETLVNQAVATMETGSTNHKDTRRDTKEGSDGNGGVQRISFGMLPDAVRETIISQRLAESQLPEAVRQSIQQRIPATADLEDVTQIIEDARTTLAAVTQSGQVENGRTAEVGAESFDKLAIGLAKAFGVERDKFLGNESGVERMVRQSGGRPFQPDVETWNTVDPLRSMRQLYVDLTGDRDISGRISKPVRFTSLVRQAQTPWATGDFAVLLSNVMHKRFLMDYREVPDTWRRVVMIKSLADFKTNEAILVGYFGDLPEVAENGEYTTYDPPTQTKESYAGKTYGKTIDLGRRTLMNDDLNAFARNIGRMGRAAHRGLNKFVWNNCLFSNPVLNADAKTLYHADHNNLITDALGTPGLGNAISKLLSQPEPGSNEKFEISIENLTVAVRPEFFLTARSLTDFNQEPQGNTDALAKQIRNLRITPVAVPWLSDANDWALFADPADIEIVEIGFINGNVEPEFFLLSGELHEKAFNNDIIVRHKVRHEYNGVPVDHRGTVKAVVV